VNTAEAACAIDYPVHRFRVIVLDDAGSKELSHKIENLKKSRENVYYTAREKPLNHHFKAGNLNHGYRYVESLPGGPAPFIAALDADMIPDPKWLRALIPHLMKDDNLALAQPPQVRISNVQTQSAKS
jgi:cellulose synthase/poly-beta-1,6-N-acetylglucosamine synthase-like glycosyltransferase